jgi:hypothetical protein
MGAVWMMSCPLTSSASAFVGGGMEESLLLGQAKTRLRSIHKEADEFLSFVVRSFKWEWQATFVQSMVDLVLEMQTATLSKSRLFVCSFSGHFCDRRPLSPSQWSGSPGLLRTEAVDVGSL